MSLQNDIPLIVLPERLAICRLAVDSPYPDWARPGEMLAFLQTRDELTVVCAERYVPPETRAERGWRILKVQGPLDFSLVGLLASITTPLARAGVSVFTLSTFDTDYILVRDEALARAVEALVQAGFLVINHVRLSS
jgi:hypothetical protein